MVTTNAVRRVVLACGLVLAASPALSAGISFKKLVDTSFVAPDGQVTFTIDRPQSNGTTTLFIAATPAPDVYLFGVPSAGGTPVDLVDTNTKVPGGTGNFTGSQQGYFTAFALGNCTVPVAGDTRAVFVGRDAAGNEGIYAVPLSGGKVKKVVDYKTAIPHGPVGSYSNFNPSYSFCNLSISGETIAFDAGSSGVYSVETDGSGLKRIADPNTPATFGDFVVNQYVQPTIEDDKITYIGGTVFGPYGVFVGAPTNAHAIVQSIGNQFDSFAYPTIGGKTILFPADLTFPNQGIFSVPSKGGDYAKVMDLKSKLPKGTPGASFSAIGSSYVDGNWVPDGDLGVFTASTTDGSAVHPGLFKACKAKLSKILTDGDMLDGVEVAPAGGISSMTALKSGDEQGAILVGGFRYAAIYTVTMASC